MVTASPLPDPDGLYASGTSVEVTATPTQGWNFNSWSGDLSGGVNPTTITMDRNKSIVGNFSQPPPNPWGALIDAETMVLTSDLVIGQDALALGGAYISTPVGGVLTVPRVEGEINFSVPDTAQYYMWARLRGISSTEDAFFLGIDLNWTRFFPSQIGAYEWVRVSDLPLSAGQHALQACHAELNARLDAVYLTNDPNDVPIFEPPPPANRFSLTVGIEPPNSGVVSVIPNPDPDGLYAAGTNVSLLAIANFGMQFDGWDGDETGMENPLSVVMDSDKVITALFSLTPSSEVLYDIVKIDESGSLIIRPR
jgi:hypothetical protein